MRWIQDGGHGVGVSSNTTIASNPFVNLIEMACFTCKLPDTVFYIIGSLYWVSAGIGYQSNDIVSM